MLTYPRPAHTLTTPLRLIHTPFTPVRTYAAGRLPDQQLRRHRIAARRARRARERVIPLRPAARLDQDSAQNITQPSNKTQPTNNK